MSMSYSQHTCMHLVHSRRCTCMYFEDAQLRVMSRVYNTSRKPINLLESLSMRKDWWITREHKLQCFKDDLAFLCHHKVNCSPSLSNCLGGFVCVRLNTAKPPAITIVNTLRCTWYQCPPGVRSRENSGEISTCR